jgi:DNA-binding Xre family transcriptional regulator
MSSTGQRSITVVSNLFALKRQLELKTGRAYTWGEIAEKADLNANTLYSLAKNTGQGVRFDTLGKLLNFFRKEGLEIEVGDLFVVTQS